MKYLIREVYSYELDGITARTWHDRAQFDNYVDARDFQDMIAKLDNCMIGVQLIDLKDEFMLWDCKKRKAA